MPLSSYQADLKHALQLADVADEISQRYYLSSSLQIATKPDATPVTQADTEVEAILSKIVTEEYREGYLGEEGVRATGDRIWVVDPIDGTKNFMRGMPVWASLIALQERGETVVACVSAPALNRRWWATKGGGAFTRDANGATRQIAVTKVTELADAFLLYASLDPWERTRVGLQPVLDLLHTSWRTRAVGDFMNYMLVAEGAADACFEPGPKLWDLAAPELIVTEAGGKVWTDASENTPAEDPRLSVASNGQLESAILSALNLA